MSKLSAPTDLGRCLDCERIERIIRYIIGKRPHEVTPADVFRAVALSLREPLLDAYWRISDKRREVGAKRVAYLSMEFLVGRLLRSTLSNLGLAQVCREMLAKHNLSYADIEAAEPDPALGNGGLGRLAAAGGGGLETLASHDMPAIGYGISYRFGLFRQEIFRGSQLEKPDRWRDGESPWLIKQEQELFYIPVYGQVVHGISRHSGYNPMWMDWQLLVAVPFDMPIAGYGGETVNMLRLFEACSSQDFDMQIFNRRRLHPRHAAEDRIGDHHAGALSLGFGP